MISLDLTMRLISSMTSELTHTAYHQPHVQMPLQQTETGRCLTLFPDQAVIPVVRVVGISSKGTPSIANYAEVELCQIVSIEALYNSRTTSRDRRT